MAVADDTAQDYTPDVAAGRNPGVVILTSIDCKTSDPVNASHPLPVTSFGATAASAGSGTINSGTQRVVEGGSATGTKSNVSGSASSVTLLAANTSRVGATITNDSSSSLYVDLSGGTASATSYSVLLTSGDYVEVPFKYNGLITGIWTTATGTARVTEFT